MVRRREASSYAFWRKKWFTWPREGCSTWCSVRSWRRLAVVGGGWRSRCGRRPVRGTQRNVPAGGSANAKRNDGRERGVARARPVAGRPPASPRGSAARGLSAPRHDVQSRARRALPRHAPSVAGAKGMTRRALPAGHHPQTVPAPAAGVKQFGVRGGVQVWAPRAAIFCRRMRITSVASRQRPSARASCEYGIREYGTRHLHT